MRNRGSIQGLESMLFSRQQAAIAADGTSRDSGPSGEGSTT